MKNAFGKGFHARMSKKLKRLESELQSLEVFNAPQSLLEQYYTPPRVAAEVLHALDMDVGFSGKCVLDLGCGCGIFGLGCISLGASRALGVDIDHEALVIAERNRNDVGLGEDVVQFLERDVVNLQRDDFPYGMTDFDIVITNPPFGIQSDGAGIDQLFVKKGLEFTNLVYFIHKSSTSRFWTQKAKELDLYVEFLIKEMPFPIQKTFKFHKHHVHEISVDLVKFQKKK